MASLPYVLVVGFGSQITNLQEFIARAKAEPAKLTYASPGVSSSNHLAMEWFSGLAGMKLTHVPYQGAAPALVDVLAGRVDAMLDNAGNVMQLIHDGRLRALAVTSQKRMDELASTPAIAETFPAFVATSWFAVVAPPKTPPTIVNTLSAAMIEALRAPDVVKKAHDLSSTIVASTPYETEVFLKHETETWRKVIQGAGIKLQ
jgi:tripartite-type tricarboxylate transporter receptor subunit TctC